MKPYYKDDRCIVHPSPGHLLDNRGVAFDAVGCSCGWSSKATGSQAKRDAFLTHKTSATSGALSHE